MSRTLMFLLLLLAVFLAGRYSPDIGPGTQEMTKTPPRPELTCSPITVGGETMQCPGWGKCVICWPDSEKPLPWQVTPAGVDDWSGNPWGAGIK
jgi:hypothetical protein